MEHSPKPFSKLILPTADVARATTGHNSYAIRNYYGKGPVAAGKRQRFLKALHLGANFKTDSVIDMGTADGIFLPTLSVNYGRVVAIDADSQFVDYATQLVNAMALANVELICNQEISFTELAQRIGPGFGLMYLLETLEHVGCQPDIWSSKADFLHRCFTLLEDSGGIVVSVPKMVGPALLFKTLVQRALGLAPEEMSWRELLGSSLMYKTDDLERRWQGGHVGFNHRKLEDITFRHFRVEKRAQSLISVFYLLRRKPSSQIRS